MRITFWRTITAVTLLASITSIAAAQELALSDIDRILSATTDNDESQHGVRQLAYLSEVGINGEPLPSGIGPSNGASCCEQDYYAEQDYCGAEQYCPQPSGMFYAEAQLMFLRAHLSDDSVGKLAEKYELSPRFILGYEGPTGLGGRARYWTYGRTTPLLNGIDNDVRFDFDVLDVEGTTRFRTARADLVLSGGFRWLDAEVEVDDDSIDTHMPGITLAADVRSMLCGSCRSQWSGVCGVRWSLLGGDWAGDDNDLIQETRDDNISVQEIYGGFEYLCHRCNYDLYARIIFEVQNWHSDALGENSASDSIGFIGPGIQVGASY